MKTIPPIAAKMPFRDVLTTIIYLKPSRASVFSEEAVAYGVRQVFKDEPDFSWLFHGRTNEGSCGATHTALDSIIDGLHSWCIEYTGDYQRSRLTELGRKYVTGEMAKEHGKDVLDELKPLAQKVWEKAGEYKHF